MTPYAQTVLNNKALTLAHLTHNKGLNSYAFFKLQDGAIGENLVQDTFVKTWAYLLKGGEIIKMKAFLYHILNNLIIDEYRKRKHAAASLDTLIENGFEPRDDAESERLINFLDGTAAARLIAGLPERYRNVIQMRFMQSLSVEEISQSTGTTKNAVAVQIHRGLEKLKVLYLAKPEAVR